MAQGNYLNSGILFKNDRKTDPKHPDYKGEQDVEGRKFWLSAWIKEGKNGKFLSLSLTPKQAQGAPPPQSANQDRAPVADSELPF